jgi:hypothetical protein
MLISGRRAPRSGDPPEFRCRSADVAHDRLIFHLLHVLQRDDFKLPVHVT